MATKKNSAADKAPAPLDIFSEALKSNVGEPIDVTLLGHTFQVRRDFTGDDVANYIALFGSAESLTVEQQIRQQLEKLTDLTAADLDAVTEELLQKPVAVTSSIMIYLGQIAGLRGEDTGFLTGTLRS